MMIWCFVTTSKKMDNCFKRFLSSHQNNSSNKGACHKHHMCSMFAIEETCRFLPLFFCLKFEAIFMIIWFDCFVKLLTGLLDKWNTSSKSWKQCGSVALAHSKEEAVLLQIWSSHTFTMWLALHKEERASCWSNFMFVILWHGWTLWINVLHHHCKLVPKQRFTQAQWHSPQMQPWASKCINLTDVLGESVASLILALISHNSIQGTDDCMWCNHRLHNIMQVSLCFVIHDEAAPNCLEASRNACNCCHIVLFYQHVRLCCADDTLMSWPVLQTGPSGKRNRIQGTPFCEQIWS